MTWTEEKGWIATVNGIQVYRRYIEGFMEITRDEIFTESGLVVVVNPYQTFKELQAAHAEALVKMTDLIK
jgi:hypothetical protein